MGGKIVLHNSRLKDFLSLAFFVSVIRFPRGREWSESRNSSTLDYVNTREFADR